MLKIPNVIIHLEIILSHVLGFAGIDNQGLMGLELYYDKELSGTKGSVKFYSDAKGERMKIWQMIMNLLLMV